MDEQKLTLIILLVPTGALYVSMSYHRVEKFSNVDEFQIEQKQRTFKGNM